MPERIIWKNGPYSVDAKGVLQVSEGITKIEEWAFEGCEWLTNIIIPEGITEIDHEAFEGHTELESVTLPDSVTKIGIGAFDGCSRLTSITIPNGVTEILQGTFRNCSSLNSAVLPEGITKIGAWAFENCTRLTDVIIPDSVTRIDTGAFRYCSELTSVEIPKGITKISGSVFFGCSKLTNVTIPDGVTEIGPSAFRECSELISVSIPDGVTEIGEEAFASCSELTSIVVPDGVSEIKERTFKGCSKLTSVTIPDSVTKIEDLAFCNCEKLASVEIPNKVSKIGVRAFSGCSELTSVTIPDSVNEINHKAFDRCPKLTNVVIQNSLTKIGKEAFEDKQNINFTIGGEDKRMKIDINYFEQMKALNEEEKILSEKGGVSEKEWDDFYQKKNALSVSLIENWKKVEITDAWENNEQNKDIACLKSKALDIECYDMLRDSIIYESTNEDTSYYDKIKIQIEDSQEYFTLLTPLMEEMCEKDDLRNFLCWIDNADMFYELQPLILINHGEEDLALETITKRFFGHTPSYSGGYMSENEVINTNEDSKPYFPELKFQNLFPDDFNKKVESIETMYNEWVSAEIEKAIPESTALFEKMNIKSTPDKLDLLKKHDIVITNPSELPNFDLEKKRIESKEPVGIETLYSHNSKEFISDFLEQKKEEFRQAVLENSDEPNLDGMDLDEVLAYAKEWHASQVLKDEESLDLEEDER